MKDKDFTVDQIIEMYHIAIEMQRLDMMWHTKASIEEMENEITLSINSVREAIEVPSTNITIDRKNVK